MAQETLQVKIEFHDEAAQDVRSALEAVGAADIDEREQRGAVGLATVLTCVLVAAALVDLVTKLLRLWRSGLVVDARGPKVLVEKRRELPRGTVLVLSPDGTESKLHEPSSQQLDALIKKFQAAGA
jgi:hypothetical protein